MHPFIKNEINSVVLHGRIHKFFNRLGCPVDFIDKQNVALFEMGENAHQIAAFFESGSGGNGKVALHFIGDNVSQCCFPKTRRAME